MAKRVGAPLAAWIACACALVGLALVAYGIDAAQRIAEGGGSGRRAQASSRPAISVK